MEERYPSEFKVNWHPSSYARPALGKAGEYVVKHIKLLIKLSRVFIRCSR